MSVLIQCSKHIRTAYSLSRHRISNTLISNTNSHISRKKFPETNHASISYCNTNILPNRSFFSSAIHQSSSANKIDDYIKNLDFNLRRVGRISKKEIEEILNEIMISKTATPSQSLMVLRCCGSLVPDETPENRTILVQKIWQTINEIGVPLDISHYNTLLKVYLENNYAFSPTEFLENLEKKGITPNRVTFQHLITGYCQNGDITGASRILEYMRDKELPINKIVFNALVMGHSQNSDMESAEGVLNVMKESNLEPTSDTYTLLASGYAKIGDIAKVVNVLDTCGNKEIYLSDKEYLDIVYSLAINGHGDKIDQVMTRISKASGYNQDAINCIYKLVTMGQEEIAFKIFDTMTKPLKADGTSPPIGRFLIGHLTKVNSSLDNVVGFCKKLVSEGTNPKAFEVATEMALKNGSIDIALGMFKYMKENNQPIRQHYFWPIFVAKNKQNDLQGLKDVLSIMINEYELNPNIDTLRFYILPAMFKNNMDGMKIINELQMLGIPTGTTTHSVVLYLLSEKKIRLAADIAACSRAFYVPSLIRRPLVNAFLAGFDVTSFIVLLQQICNGFSRYSLVTSPELSKQDKFDKNSIHTEEQIIEMREFISQVLIDIVRNTKQTSGVVEIIHELLENMYGKGLGINAYASEQVQNHLQGKLTFEIISLLENLTDSNLVIKAELSVKPGGYTLSNTDESTLEKIVNKADVSGESKNGTKRQLLNLYCKNNNLEKASAFKDKLSAEGFNIPPGSMVLLLDVFLNHNKLTEAKQIFNELKTNNPEFTLDKFKVIKMTEVIAKTDSVEDAIDFLSSFKKIDDNTEFTSFQHANVCWKLLNTIAETGNVENLQKMFDLIINNNYITVSNILLGPLIKVHIVNNNIKGALEKFEWCCKTYRCTPWKNELASKFIQAEDAISLQVLTDLSTTVHGEVNSLYDLMFAFIECGRVKQARKILETPGLRTRQDRINSACAKYGSDNAEESLIRLLEVTKNIGQFDRTNIFNELLHIYSKNNKVEEAMTLWTQMQEEDCQPSENFMWTLSELLKKNNLEVPFTVKKPKEKGLVVPSDINKSLSTELELCIKNNNITQALVLRKTLYSKGHSINSSSESKIVELLTREKKLKEAFAIAKEMLENSRPITKSILAFLVKNLSEAGHIGSLEYLNAKVTKVMSNKLNLNSKIFNAYQSNGNINDLIARLETDVDENIKDPIKLSELIKNVPGGNLVSILNKDSSVIPIIERLHTKVSPHGYKIFANSLWSHFMLNKKFDEAFKIAKELENEKFIQYRQLLSDIRSNNNIELGYKLLEVLPKFKETNQNANLGIVYSAIIDSYVNQGNVIEASNVLDKALEKITLEDINKSAILRIKNNLESKGEIFKYNIDNLEKKTNFKNSNIHSEDSSDSSDDEKVAKV
ncbi:leucine-rich PPR motif-containing protein, mitochondrial [Melanaphis sacchari]|uniref:Leucine-rich PPR motif-containing protein, mitochondrial n=1 Tax=Melanaphis sacchari TaxID=742174 RepID=A0A2H8TGU9_9HEMI|nr:leucine-rich PPR motif-containing protein, mitochondrial [Melanaphis sacchari]